VADQIEMFWQCSACGTINGGLSKRCGERVVKDGKVVLSSGEGCGKDMDHQNWFMPQDISKYANLTEDKHIAQAKEGADWMCAYCGSTQRNSRGGCAVCGAGRELSNELQSEKRIHQPAYEGPTYRELNYEDSLPPARSNKKRNILFAVGAGVVLVSGILIWIFTPRYVDAQVQSAAWTSVVQVERYKRIRDEGWHAPGDAEEVRDEGRRVHHHDRVQTGTKQEHYTERVACGQNCTTVSVPRVCTSNKNGTATCTGGGTTQQCTTKYCNEPRTRTVPVYEDVPRYQNWYSWHAWRWRHQRKVGSSGSDLRPHPPNKNRINLNVGCTGKEKERQGAPEYTYKCTFRDEDGEVRTYEPSAEGDYQQCTTGRAATLKLVAGMVSIKEWR
jgi:hypothetical protein